MLRWDDVVVCVSAPAMQRELAGVEMLSRHLQTVKRGKVLPDRLTCERAFLSQNFNLVVMYRSNLILRNMGGPALTFLGWKVTVHSPLRCMRAPSSSL